MFAAGVRSPRRIEAIRAQYPIKTQPTRRSAIPLIQLVIILVVLGVILWVVNTYIPMDATIKKFLNVVVVLVAVLYILGAFGILDSLSGIHTGN